jgi:hypothetical protein
MQTGLRESVTDFADLAEPERRLLYQPSTAFEWLAKGVATKIRFWSFD